MVETDSTQMTIYVVRRMCIACWISKTTDAHSEYEVLIAFSWQQWLRERTALLRVYVL
jgi:hypothetical protein